MQIVEQPSGVARVGVRALLAAIESGDSSWSEALGEFTLDALALAVYHQIRAGNLADGQTLTPLGRATLARLRGEELGRTPRLVVRREHDCDAHPDGCWRIDCNTCRVALVEHLGDSDLDGAVFDAGEHHVCGVPAPRSANS